MKIKKYRIGYLLVSLGLGGFMLYQLIAGICTSFEKNAGFSDIINLFSLLFALLFETGIILFIIRSLRCNQTLLMKNLVFNRDGTPFRAGINLSIIGSILFVAVGVFFLFCGYGHNILANMDRLMLLFIADVALLFGINLGAVFVYFLLFRHEAGAFVLI